MIKSDIQPQNLPETLVWYYIVGTYGVYLLGAQFFFAILLALFLLAFGLWQWWLRSSIQPEQRGFSIAASIWLLSMLTLELALVIGHLDYGYGWVSIAKSSLKWIPFVLFPLAGYLVNIRPKLIYRAACILCLQSLILIPILIGTALLKIPKDLYTSPLAIMGGEETRYKVVLYIMDLGQLRLTLFAPHCPALGLVGGILFCLALQDPNLKWRGIGIVGSLGMVLSSVSRAGILSIPFVLLVLWVTQNLARPWFYFLLACLSLVGGIFLPQLLDLLDLFQANFYAFREGSSHTREILEKMALAQWSEAPIWGHGLIESRGPRITGGMAIGTHHTWFGLLFTQGVVGFMAMIIGLGGMFVNLVVPANLPKSIQQSGIGILTLLLLFTFADIVYDYSYIYWPGLLLIGMSFKTYSAHPISPSF